MLRAELISRASVLCLATVLGVTSVRAEWNVSCARELVFAVTHSYACQAYMNFHAIRTKTPSAMVTKISNGQFLVSFTSRSGEGICGSFNFEPRKVTSTADQAQAMAAIRLQGAINEAFYRADSDVQREAIALAEAVMDLEAAKTAAPTLQPLESVMATFEGAMRDAIASHSVDLPIETSAERCTIKIAGITVSPPLVSPPDIRALARYKDAHTDYQKFRSWLMRHTKPGEMVTKH